MSDLPERLRAIAESLEGDDWEHPITAQATCLRAATVIEQIVAKCGHFAGEALPPGNDFSALRLVIAIANIATERTANVAQNEERQVDSPAQAARAADSPPGA